jgi:hypothetical protein
VAASAARPSYRWIAALASALFLAALAVYARAPVSAAYNRSDPLLVAPTAISLLRDGDLELGEFGNAIDPAFYGVLHVDGRPYNRYPIGTSLLILPVAALVAAPASAGIDHMAEALRVAGVAARVLAALSVALLFLLLVALDGGWRRPLALAALFAFATVHYPIHAGGLWTHNAVLPLVLVALLLLVVRDGRHAWTAAVPLAMAFVTRPTCVPLIVLLTVWVARQRPDAFARYAVTGTTLGVLFAGWSQLAYGTPLPPYYLSFDDSSPYRMSVGRFATALAGHLVSPNRGLFVFTPVLAFSVYGMVRAFRAPAGPHAALQRTLALAVVAHWLVISVLARKWWAGHSFGPRHLVELCPLLVVLLLPALDGVATWPPARRALAVPFAAVALAWSAFVAVHGATSPAPHEWSALPANVDERPARVWDWSDLQMLRGVRVR